MKSIPQLVQEHEESLKLLHEYFGLVGNPLAAAIEGHLDAYWAKIDGQYWWRSTDFSDIIDWEDNFVAHFDQEIHCADPDEDVRKDGYTAVLVNSEIGGDPYMMIFDNAKEIKRPTESELSEEGEPEYEFRDDTAKLPLEGNVFSGDDPDWLPIENYMKNIYQPNVMVDTTRLNEDLKREGVKGVVFRGAHDFWIKGMIELRSDQLIKFR